MVNLPALFTSLVPTSARVSSTFLTAAGFSSAAVASAAARPDFDMAALFIAAAFIARPC